jgi:hypothetical protein
MDMVTVDRIDKNVKNINDNKYRLLNLEFTGLHKFYNSKNDLIHTALIKTTKNKYIIEIYSPYKSIL